jgi:hypothetical protein
MAVPVENGKFSFSIDSFYVKASNGSLHRRATLSDLHALFQPGSATTPVDHVGHWYEAQLLHYGLPPSKSKAVAKTRLLDAYRARNLVVPKDITKLEADLKKEWKRRDKESRSQSNAAGTVRKEKEPMKPATSKRKREEGEEDAARGIKNPNKKTITTTIKAAADGKRQKPADAKATVKSIPKSSPKPTTKKTPQPKNKTRSETKEDPPARKKQTARRGGAAVGPKYQREEQSPPSDTMVKTQIRTKQTARRGGAAVGPKHQREDASPPSDTMVKTQIRTKQTARRGGAAVGPKKTQEKGSAPSDTTVKKEARTKQTARRGSGLSNAGTTHKGADITTPGPVYHSSANGSPKQSLRKGERLCSPSGRAIHTAHRSTPFSFQASNDKVSYTRYGLVHNQKFNSRVVLGPCQQR